MQTTRMIADIFPMFELTLDGLDDGVKFLMQGKGRLNA